ncbi:MAG: hypothetical protein WA071_23335 [Undibacterium umbellatum]|uniref:hypothetical protein n=1 Tax=Undibacterium umbellatum TaxID=2762300 RepID=UPI003BB62680
MNYQATPTLADCSIVSIAEALERYPAFPDAMGDYLDMDDIDDDALVLVAEGDFILNHEWDDLLEEAEACYLLIDGNVQLDDFPSHICTWVSGDLQAESLNLVPREQCILGQITASHYVSLQADDDGITRKSPLGRIHTPYLFVWFYRIDRLQLNPDCMIFTLTHWQQCQSLQAQLPNPVFIWHEGRYVLRDDMQSYVESEDYDGMVWSLWNIRKALQAGQPILRDGFDPAVINIMQEAEDAKRSDNDCLAWLQYRRATEVCPMYYPAWFQQGWLLFKKSAFEQALPLLQHAAQLYPKSQRSLVNDAAFYACLSALQLGQTALALDIINQAMRSNTHTDLHRARAEVFMLMGDKAAARADLEHVLADAPDAATANWLMGVLHHLDGAPAKAEKHRKIAIAAAAKFDVSYEDYHDTSFMRGTAIRLDWDQKKLQDVMPVRDQAWWRQQLLADPVQIKRMPAEWRSSSLLAELITQHPGQAKDYITAFTEEAITPDLARQLVATDASLLALLPLHLIDKAVCLAASKTKGLYPITAIPAHVLDHDICMHAAQCNAKMSEIPEAYLTREVCKLAIAQNAFDIKHTPAALLDEEMWLFAIAHGHTYFQENAVPKRYKTNDIYKRALSMNQQMGSKYLLNELPGQYFNAELYAHAQSLYGDDPEWPAIVSQHQAKNCLDSSTDYAEKCWLVFWDEASMLHKIRQGSSGYSLSPYEIPASMYTQAIADACYQSSLTHLRFIPAQFINDAMCKRFIEHNADELSHIPIARRSLEICVYAILSKPEQASQIPADIHAPVYDALLRHYPEHPEKHRWHLERGRGYLMLSPARPDMALTDFEYLIMQADSVPAMSDTAAYLKAYCLYLQGQQQQAQACLELHGLSDQVAFAEFQPQQDKPITDFDQLNFDETMYDYERFAQNSKTHHEAWQSILLAEQLLIQSGNTSPVLWAHVLDKKRWITYELEMWEENLAACRLCVQRLQSCVLWEYIASDNVIRAALRAAWHRLGSLPLGEENASQDALEQGLELLKKTLSLRSASEDESVLDDFYDTYLRLLLALSAFQNKYAAAFALQCKKVRGMKWRSFIHTETLIDKLEEPEA